ncbi:MAG: hypothetical protein M1813_007912 [Trichoglossum hirsutum]|nr:MAG: hypothetical protein M1813_007912 [Trichoglossum hirsutum]
MPSSNLATSFDDVLTGCMLTLSVIEKIEKLEAEHKVMTDKAELDEKAVEMLDHNLDEVVIRAGNLEISVRKAKEEAAAQKLALETYIRATAQRRQNFLDDLEKTLEKDHHKSSLALLEEENRALEAVRVGPENQPLGSWAYYEA